MTKINANQSKSCAGGGGFSSSLKASRRDETLTTASLRGMSGANDEAIYNTESRFKDSIAKLNVANIIDCHDSANAESRNDEVGSAKQFNIIDCHDSANAESRNDRQPNSSLRGTNAVRDEAIYNLNNQKIFNGEILNYGFALKRVNLLTQMHATKTFKASRNDEVGSAKQFNVIDCHDSANAESRNDRQPNSSLRGMNAVRDEAIYNLNNQKIFNGEILSYGFALKRVNLLPQMHATKTFKASRNDEVGSAKQFHIIDCHETLRVSRNDAMAKHNDKKRFHSRTSLLTASLLGILASGAMVSQASAWTYGGANDTITNSSTPLSESNGTISSNQSGEITNAQAIKGGNGQNGDTKIDSSVNLYRTQPGSVLEVTEESGTVTNAGTLKQKSGVAVWLAPNNNNGKIGTFENTGTIQAGGTGIEVRENAEVGNIKIGQTGTITANGLGIHLKNGAQVTGDIQVDGTIKSMGWGYYNGGVHINSGASVDNIKVGETGKILSQKLSGIELRGTAGGMEIKGTVAGNYYGIATGGGGKVTGTLKIDGGRVVGLSSGADAGTGVWVGLDGKSEVKKIEITDGAVVGVRKYGASWEELFNDTTKDNATFIEKYINKDNPLGIYVTPNGKVDEIAVTKGNNNNNSKGDTYISGIAIRGETKSVNVDGAEVGIIENRSAKDNGYWGNGTIGNISLKDNIGTTKIKNGEGATITGGIKLEGTSKASYEGEGEIRGGDDKKHFITSGSSELDIKQVVSKPDEGGITIENTSSNQVKVGEIVVDTNNAGNLNHLDQLVKCQGTDCDFTQTTLRGKGFGLDLNLNPLTGEIGAQANPLSAGAVQAAITNISTNNLRNATITNIVTNALTDMQNVFNHSTTFYQAELGTKVASAVGTENIAQDIVDSNTLYDKDKGLFLIPYYSKQKIDSSDVKADGNIEGFLAGYNGATLDALFYSLFLGYDRTTNDVESIQGSSPLDIDADSFYGGFQVAKYLKNLGDSSELYLSVNGMLGTTSADIERYTTKGVYYDDANARSYFWNLGADIFVNYLAGKNIITPKVGISYQGDANKKYEFSSKNPATKVFHSYNHLYRTRASVAWSRAWTPKLSSTAELGVKYLFNPEIDTEVLVAGVRGTRTHELDRFESYLNLGLSYLIRNAFILSLMYYGNYSSDITGHTGYVRLNYLF